MAVSGAIARPVQKPDRFVQAVRNPGMLIIEPRYVFAARQPKSGVPSRRLTAPAGMPDMRDSTTTGQPCEDMLNVDSAVVDQDDFKVFNALINDTQQGSLQAARSIAGPDNDRDPGCADGG